MWIGIQKIDCALMYSKFNGKFWTGYGKKIMNVGNNLSRSSCQNYIPIMSLELHRWNDDC